MTAPTIESALLVSARQLAEEARDRRRARALRRRPAGVPGPGERLPAPPG